MELLEWLKGKRTYTVAAAIALLTFLKLISVIDDNTYQTLLGLFGATGLAALRAGMKK